MLCEVLGWLSQQCTQGVRGTLEARVRISSRAQNPALGHSQRGLQLRVCRASEPGVFEVRWELGLYNQGPRLCGP